MFTLNKVLSLTDWCWFSCVTPACLPERNHRSGAQSSKGGLWISLIINYNHPTTYTTSVFLSDSDKAQFLYLIRAKKIEREITHFESLHTFAFKCWFFISKGQVESIDIDLFAVFLCGIASNDLDDLGAELSDSSQTSHTWANLSHFQLSFLRWLPHEKHKRMVPQMIIKMTSKNHILKMELYK